MKYRKLGRTDIDVSVICLGTMTWGEQNTKEEAHEQLDYAFERGVNFIDTAEMYPVPPKSETYTHTESIIGQWEKLKTARDKVVLATKVVGPGFDYVRGGDGSFSKKNIMEAVDNSLARLNTDYIDLYQLHWPDRATNYFGERSYKHLAEREGTPINEILETLKEIQDSGKVKHFGLSNETPWGTMKFLSEAQKKAELPQIVSIQNPYSLLNRIYEVGMAEVSMREGAGLLAYSPLAFGLLTGKYRHGAKPKGARLTLWERFSRYTNPNGLRASELYFELAEKYGISPTHLALSFVNSREFVTSNIIGATNLDQLKENIDSIDIELSTELLQEIEEVQNKIPDPCP